MKIGVRSRHTCPDVTSSSPPRLDAMNSRNRTSRDSPTLDSHATARQMAIRMIVNGGRFFIGMTLARGGGRRSRDERLLYEDRVHLIAECAGDRYRPTS